ncbi:hypothetical protein V5O48_008550 [Marasmius crinis-equi]|uniref:Uncharacterized protein n=1 Tax=Marasmius crinis-equi TaxID=585013 RepID=A0ABR3FDJ8_9AGAR
MSKLVGIFGALSLPPDAPRITNAHTVAIGSKESASYWDFVQALIRDKEKLGYTLSDGDRYWIMWTKLVDIRERLHGDASEREFAVEEATRQVESIWPRTKMPDLLAPYFQVVLEHRKSHYLSKALYLLCDVLAKHRNVHPGLVSIVWKFLLVDPASLTPESKERLLSILWDRAQVHPHPVAASGSISTHTFNWSTKRHDPHVLSVRQLVAALSAPLFPILFTPVPSSVTQWATRTLRAALSPALACDHRWRNAALLALCHSFTSVSPILVSHPHSFSEWDAILTLRTFQTIIPELPDVRTEGAQMMLRSLWKRWLEIPDEVDRPSFVKRAFAAGCIRLAGLVGALDICNDGYRYCAQQGLLLLDSAHTRTERMQVDALVSDYTEAFVSAGGGRFAHVLRSINSSSSTLAANAILTLSSFIHRDIAIAYDLYTYCVESKIPVPPDMEFRLAIALAPALSSATIPFLAKYRRDLEKLQQLFPALVCSFAQHRRLYINPTEGGIIAEAMVLFCDNVSPIPSLRFPIYHTLTLLTPHRPKTVIHVVETIARRSPTYFPPSFLHSLIRVFLKHRYYWLAARLHRLIRSNSEESPRIRETLFFTFVRGDAKRLAYHIHPSLMAKLRKLSALRFTSPFRGPTVLSMARLHGRRLDPRIISVLPSLIQNQVIARKTLVMVARYMNAGMKTVLGNAYLDRLVCKGKSMRVLYLTKDHLARRTGFVEDRVTLNILVKALLRKRGNLDGFRVRCLFDEFVRNGYPVQEHWLRSHSVPFGTSPGAGNLPPLNLTIPKGSRISFKKHVEPLYKMFIKALYLRQDIVGAETMVGILKGEEVADLIRKKKKAEARIS